MGFILFVAQIVLAVCEVAGATSLGWTSVLMPLWIYMGYKIPMLLILWAAATQEKHPTERR